MLRRRQNSVMTELNSILAEIEAAAKQQAERRAWNPARRGSIDIRIAADGGWYHEGRRFRRESLVRLFAGILRREGDDYFLVTPAEKLRVEVEDAPFVATLVEAVDDNGEPAILFTTNVGERVIFDADHPLRIETDPASGAPRPYLRLRDGLDALISRSAFYDLVNMAEERERDGSRYLYLRSRGQDFELGKCDDE